MTLLKPPILTGNTQNDLYRLRDYLFQLSGSLEAAATAPAAQSTGGSASTDKATVAAVRKSAQELRDLIVKSADRVEQESRAYTDGKTTVYDAKYLATSAFGVYEDNTETRLTNMAGQIQENYNYSHNLSTELTNYATQIEGEIRRGFIDNPDYPSASSDQYVFGIAISSKLEFTGTVRTEGGFEYYQLKSGQTFGLYTSTGWQFWINGQKTGWFSSTDNMLHVRRVVAEELFQVSGMWQMRTADSGRELEFVYIGS